MKYLKYLKLYESYESKPEIFSHTIYRLPTQNELQEFENYDLSSEDIIKGFSYTIIGRGIKSNNHIQMIIESIKMLCDKFPNNEIYKEALSKIKKDNH